MNEKTIFLISSTVSGVILGSFYTVCIDRFIRGESIIHPLFSHCPDCGKQLKPYELVPIFSYFFLRGRCSSCNGKIGLFYPVVEFGTGAIVALLALRFGPTIQFGVYLFFFSLLIIASGIDFKIMIIPDWITLGATLPAILCAVFLLRLPWAQSLAGGAVGFFSFWLLRALYRKIRHTEGLGLGDAKLILFIGTLCGIKALPDIVLIASGSALLFSLVVKQKKLFFGPFLSIGAFVSVIDPIILL